MQEYNEIKKCFFLWRYGFAEHQFVKELLIQVDYLASELHSFYQIHMLKRIIYSFVQSQVKLGTSDLVGGE
jgi:hypothetical protein